MGLIKISELAIDEVEAEPETVAAPPVLVTKSKGLALRAPTTKVLDGILPALPPDHDYDLLSKGRWSLHQLVSHIIGLIGPCDCSLTSYGISTKPIQCILDLLRSKQILTITALFDKRIRLQCPDAFQLLLNLTDDERVRIGLTMIHAKVVVLSNADHQVTIRTSANLNVNPRIEIYDISTHAGRAQFHQQWIADAYTEAKPFNRHDS